MRHFSSSVVRLLVCTSLAVSLPLHAREAVQVPKSQSCTFCLQFLMNHLTPGELASTGTGVLAAPWTLEKMAPAVLRANGWAEQAAARGSALLQKSLKNPLVRIGQSLVIAGGVLWWAEHTFPVLECARPACADDLEEHQ